MLAPEIHQLFRGRNLRHHEAQNGELASFRANKLGAVGECIWRHIGAPLRLQFKRRLSCR